MQVLNDWMLKSERNYSLLPLLHSTTKTDEETFWFFFSVWNTGIQTAAVAPQVLARPRVRVPNQVIPGLIQYDNSSEETDRSFEEET